MTDLGMIVLVRIAWRLGTLETLYFFKASKERVRAEVQALLDDVKELARLLEEE